jgi:ATP-dependent Clp protease ATP-binding subunit ClpB
MLEYTKRFLRQQPKVSGDSAQVLGRQLEALVDRARNLRLSWGDEFVSGEHILLAYVDDARFGSGLMRAFSLTQDVSHRYVHTTHNVTPGLLASTHT